MENDLEKYFESNELALARAVQKALLAGHAPTCSCGKIVVKNRMTTSIGGDFYHFRELGQDQVAFAIGDVMGHGMPAALVMSLILGLLQADRLDNRKPTRVAESINDMLVQLGEQVDNPITCSMIYGVVDLPSGILLYVNAGHPHPILCNRTYSKPREIATTTMLLGVEKRMHAESCHQFNKNERMVLYTDGITEAGNGKQEQFGEKRLHSLVSDWAEHPPERLTETLFYDLDRFRQDLPLQDDQTIVVIDFDNVSSEKQKSMDRREEQYPMGMRIPGRA